MGKCIEYWNLGKGGDAVASANSRGTGKASRAKGANHASGCPAYSSFSGSLAARCPTFWPGRVKREAL